MGMASKSDRAFTDDDDEEEDYGKRDGSARRDSTVKMDGQSNWGLKAISPRSKHSATEQRRRSKINDRFQILSDLVPHRDQKRDKASLLLEVIEHIQYLHEKVQKSDSSFPEWNNANSKMMPWRVAQVPPKAVGERAQLTQNGLSPAVLISGDNAISAATTILSLTNCQASLELENVSSVVENKDTFSGLLPQYNNDGGYAQSQPTVISHSENVAPQSHGYMLNGQDVAVDDGTISISCPYSHGLLQALSQTLQDCSVDLSEANISVQINLGKRALSRSVSSHKDHVEDSAANHVIGFSQMDCNAEESDHATKRLKTDTN